MRIALATSQPELPPSDRLLEEALRARAVAVEVAHWQDASCDWSRFDTVVVRSCWNYHHHLADFLAAYNFAGSMVNENSAVDLSARQVQARMARLIDQFYSYRKLAVRPPCDARGRELGELARRCDIAIPAYRASFALVFHQIERGQHHPWRAIKRAQLQTAIGD